MKHILTLTLVLLLTPLVVLHAADSPTPAKPNILFLVSDDLRPELGCYSMRTDRYRFTQWLERADQSKVDAVELYDHQTDPQENTNIANAPANKALVEKLTAQWLAGWKGAVAKP